MKIITNLSQATKKKKKHIEGFFSIKINIENLFPLNFEDTHGDESGECIEEYQGQILHEVEDDKTVLVGKFTFTILNGTRALNNDFSPMDTFDTGGEPTEFYQLIYDYGTCDFNEFIEDSLGGDAFGSSSAYISSVEILPKYRGIGLCKKVLSSILNFLSGKVEIVVMKSFPLQFQPFIMNVVEGDENKKWYEDMGYYSELSKVNLKSAQKKLNNLYLSFGFKEIQLPDDWIDKDEYYFGLNLNFKNPLISV